MGGWIKLFRDIRDHWIWTDAEKLKWWLDILLSANHQDNKFLLGNELMDIKRGEFHTSVLKLAERWGAERKTVNRFLKLLEKDEMISLNSTRKGTTIKVSNYNAYQSLFEDGMDNTVPNKVPTDDPTKSQQKGHKQECKECKEGEEEQQQGELVVVELKKQYEDCFGRLITPMQLEELRGYLKDNLELELIKHVMSYSMCKDDYWKYLKKVLNACVDKNIKSVHEFEMNLKTNTSKKENGSQSKIERFNNMYSRDWDFDEIEKLEQEYIDKKLEEMNHDE